MSPLLRHLASYASYHRDGRNVATHVVGIPMIFFAVTLLLGWPLLTWQGVPVSAATAVGLAACLYYLRLDVRYGLAMTAITVVAVAASAQMHAASAAGAFGWGAGLFVVGWILQAVGHVFEGRKPAFFDDVRGLLIGPLFLVAEAGFRLGLRRDVQAAMGHAEPVPA